MNKLTKSKFRSYLECPREFWLAEHYPEELNSVITPDIAFRIRQGYEVERLARKHLRSRGDNQYLNWREVESERLFARFDVFVEDGGDGGAHIYEVKSSKYKDAEDSKGKQTRAQNLLDVAFQVFAARESGLKISRAFLITLNGEYVLGEELDPAQFLVVEDVSGEVEALQETVGDSIGAAFGLIASEPDPGFEVLCSKKLNCEYIRFSVPDLPERTIFDIPRLHKTKKASLLAMGVLDLRDVPDDFELTATQREFVDFVNAGTLEIKRGEIAVRLAELEYPLYFLDYETVNPSIPQFKGMSPLQHITFQHSLHVRESRGSDLVHHEFLSDGNGVPPRDVAEHLASVIGESGSVLVWYKSFEMGRNVEMARMFPEYSGFFSSVNDRIFDLYEIFSQNLYRDPALRSNSLKAVLPKLIPDLSYHGMNIGNGGEALARWYDEVFRGEDPAKKETTMKALREYCELDTFAMVRILDYLQALVD